MPIRCRECLHTGLAHTEHARPEELKQIRALSAALLAGTVRAEARQSLALDADTREESAA